MQKTDRVFTHTPALLHSPKGDEHEERCKRVRPERHFGEDFVRGAEKCLLATMVRKSPPTMRAKKPAGVGPEAASRFFEKYGSMHTEFGPQKKSGAVVIVRPNAEK